MRYCGIDLHSNNSVVVVTDETDKVLLSQSHVSGHIKALEDFYAVRLFDRQGRAVRLTEAGRILDQYCQRLFALTVEIQHALDEYKGLLRGKLMAGASTTPGTYLMPRLLGLFHERHPQIELDLIIGNSHEIQERVRKGEIEVALIGQPPELEELAVRPVADDEIVVVVAPRHALAGRTSIPLARLAEEQLVLREEGSSTRQAALQAMAAKGLRPARLMELGSNSAVVQAVAANLGVGLVSRHAVQSEVALGQVVILKVTGLKIARRFNMIWRRDKHLSPAARRFLEVIDEWWTANGERAPRRMKRPAQ